MMIYRSLIRSKIDYGCIVYNSASSRELESKESSLQVLTEQSTIQIRRDKMSLKYYYKMKILLHNRALKFFTPEQEALYANRKSSASFAIKIKKIHTKLNWENKRVLPEFLYYRLEINLLLTDYLRDKTSTLAYPKRFPEVIRNEYRGWENIYKDGPKSEIRVGAAATTVNRTDSA